MRIPIPSGMADIVTLEFIPGSNTVTLLPFNLS